MQELIISWTAGMNLLNSFKVCLCIVFTPRLVPMWDGGCIRKFSEIKAENLAKVSFSLGVGAFPIQQRNLVLSLHIAQDILPYKILYFTCNIFMMVYSTPFSHHRRISGLLISNMSLPPSLLQMTNLLTGSQTPKPFISLNATRHQGLSPATFVILA